MALMVRAQVPQKGSDLLMQRDSGSGATSPAGVSHRSGDTDRPNRRHLGAASEGVTVRQRVSWPVLTVGPGPWRPGRVRQRLLPAATAKALGGPPAPGGGAPTSRSVVVDLHRTVPQPGRARGATAVRACRVCAANQPPARPMASVRSTHGRPDAAARPMEAPRRLGCFEVRRGQLHQFLAGSAQVGLGLVQVAQVAA
jgi:hypothetical protein